MRERDALDDQLKAIGRIEQELEDQLTLIELGESGERRQNGRRGGSGAQTLKTEVARRELEALLSGEADANDCYLEVHAGAGGTESQDWASMLMRMYVRWAEAHGYKVEWIEETEGEGAGIKSATVVIKGHNAYGWLKSEDGVHRLVRISPFDCQCAAAHVIRQRQRLSGGRRPHQNRHQGKRCAHRRHAIGRRGGQHVNKTESAVRLTHIPTNIVVKCQRIARNIAIARWPGTCCARNCSSVEIKKREDKAAAEQAAKTDIGWGHQIRSYVLQPYQMVKDLRTGVSTSNTAGVLDGDLDEFMQAALAQKAFGGGPENVEDVE